MTTVMSLPERSPQRAAFFGFLSQLTNGNKMAFMGRVSRIFNGPNDDLEGLNFILNLDPAEAEVVGKKIQDLDEGDPKEFRDQLKVIFQDEQSFMDFVGIPMEHTGGDLVKRLKRKKKKTEEDVKSSPVNEQLQHYKRKLSSRGQS